MRFAGAYCLLVGAAWALGCSAAGSSVGSPGGGAGFGGFSGSQGSGGSWFAGSSGSKVDAAASSSDAGSRGDGAVESLASNLATDATSFNWDTHVCSGCSGGGGAGGGGTTGVGPGGVSGGSGGKGPGGATSGGTGGSSGKGGLPSSDAGAGASGSVGAGGSASVGGRSGAGGSVGVGGGYSADAASSPDAGAVDTKLATDLPVPADAAPDVRGGGGSDSMPDSGPSQLPDALPTCVAQIVPVVPALARLDRLVAGSNTKVVLHADVISGSVPTGALWSWQAFWEGSPLSVPAVVGTQDPAAAMFPIVSPGNYTFRATSGACQVAVSGYAVAANACTSCDKSVILRAAPPVTADVPVQSGAMALLGSSPFDQNNVILARGVPVRVLPSVGSKVVNSYVRINDALGSLVVDGLADAQAGGFATQLLALDNNRSVLKYDVLVVPINGTDDGTVPATAPQLYQSLAPSGINGSFALAGGVTVTGITRSVSGPLQDVRVMLTNQDPASLQQRRDLVFSSVGRSDAQGSYALHVQKGTYWVSFSPPPSSGLSEAMGASSITIGSDANLAFQWNAPTTAGLTLTVVDSMGAALPGVSVRVTSSQSQSVGSLTLTPTGGAASSQPASGNVQVEDTTDAAGMVVFDKLPANETYDVLLVPATPDAHAATTTMTVILAAGGTSMTAPLWPQSNIIGQLVARTSLPLDYAGVSIVAYDRTIDSPEAPRAVKANPDGSFVFGVTPGRPYVLLATPDIASGYARTFVGPGPVRASEFVITQNLLTSMPWSAVVMDETQNGLPDTALQVYCDPSWPNCVDPGVPLAETTSDVGGAFDLALPDPSSR